VLTKDGYLLVQAALDGTTTTVVSPTGGYAAQIIEDLSVSGYFTVYTLKPVMTVRYDANRSRTETLKFTLVADVQEVSNYPGSAEVGNISLRASDVGLRIGTGVDAETPLDWPGAARYFQTARGRQSVENLIARAAAVLVKGARVVEVSFEVALSLALSLDLSCRQSVVLTHDEIPGGATGKIIAYVMSSVAGDDRAKITIGCAVGNGGTVAATAGEPSYVAEGYFAPSETQFYSDSQVKPLADQVTYTDYLDQAIDDDGIDFDHMTPDHIVNACLVINGEAAQKEVLGQFFYDIPNAIQALSQAYTQVEIDMTPVAAGPFDSSFALGVSQLKIPMGIDLASSG